MIVQFNHMHTKKYQEEREMKNARFKWYYKWNEINLETQTTQLRATWSCISSSSKRNGHIASLDMVDSKDNLKVQSSSAKRYLHLWWDLVKTHIWRMGLPIRRNGPPSLVSTKNPRLHGRHKSQKEILEHPSCK
jgi:hypothetical protein